MTVGYDGKPLIKEINIQLKKGEILTLIGPNGAGKSTILKSITRQLAAISGTVYLDKQTMSKMSNKEVSQKLAVVLTERMRPELMTCHDIVATGRYPYTGRLGILSREGFYMESFKYSKDRPGDDPGETYDIREYRSGDSIRQIHWKLSGKHKDGWPRTLFG